MPVGHPRVAVGLHRGCDGPRFIAKKKKAALSKPQKEDPSKESRDLSQGQYGRQRPRPAEPTRRPRLPTGKKPGAYRFQPLIPPAPKSLPCPYNPAIIPPLRA